MLTDSLSDIWTIMRKEWLEWNAGRDNVLIRGLNPLLFSAIFGIVLALVLGISWSARLLAVLVWAWLPLFLLVGYAADTFAGEREQHTLEMLLASRLNERVIVLGKVLAVALYGWLLLLLAFFAALLAATFVHGNADVTPTTVGRIATVAGFAFTVSWFFGTVGVLVSMCAASKREAKRLLLGGMLAVLALLLLATSLSDMFRLKASPDWMTGPAGASDPYALLTLAALGLTAVNGGLSLLLCCRFRRTRFMVER